METENYGKHVKQLIHIADKRETEKIYAPKACLNCGAMNTHSNFCDECCAVEYYEGKE